MITRLSADIETDDIDAKVIHCLVTQNIDTGELYKYDDSGQHESLTTGLNVLATADEVWMHNGSMFDIPVIKKLYPFFKMEGKLYDTLLLSRLFFPDLLDRDFRSKPPNMPAQMYSRHSLEAWGYRIGEYKSEYMKSVDKDFSVYTPEMLEYCCQDVRVLTELTKIFQPKLEQYQQAIDLEHKVAAIMAWQEKNGWPFDIEKAQVLEDKLRRELEKLSDEMRGTFHYVDGGPFVPKRDNSTRGYVTGAAFTRLKDFNPCSRQHIAFAFETFRGWEPTEKTETGRAKIDESVLFAIGTEESKKFARILELQKHLGMLSEGQNAWLKRVKSDSRIHHSCVMNTNTFRQVHLRPNLSQVPSAKEYRELFHPGKGRVEVGCDASGLELRILGSYLFPFDGGKFAREVVEGDIHTHLGKIYGSADRASSKRTTYCLIYGGGNYRLGLAAGCGPKDAARKGKEIRGKVLKNLAGFSELSAALSERSRTGVLKALDGRPLRLCGKPHVALNWLCQSAGAIVCKIWLVKANEHLREANIDYFQMGFIHDEMQFSVHPDHAEKAASIITKAIKHVAKYVPVKCELDAEAQIGNTWADCH
jgi:DNA polymerase-1